MPTIAVDGTLLVMTSPLGVPLYSARGLTQTLSPIEAAKVIRRTINGEAIALSLISSQKYDTEISASDVVPPALANIWPGQQVTIDCVAELSYRTSGGAAGRTVVSGSSRTAGSFTIFRPQIVFMITDFSIGAEEWTAGRPWSLRATEV